MKFKIRIKNSSFFRYGKSEFIHRLTIFQNLKEDSLMPKKKEKRDSNIDATPPVVAKFRRRRCSSNEKGVFEENGRESLLIHALTSFYKETPRHMEVLVFFLKKQKRRLSLRLLDWLVTNYAKKHNVVIGDASDNREFLYLAYKNHLKSYSKRFFDAFARRQRIFYGFDHSVQRITHDDIDRYIARDDGIITTIAQLNAFRFFITSGVVDYAICHLDSIENDMMSSQECREIRHRQKTNTSSIENENNSPIEKARNTGFNTFVISRFKMTVQFT